MTAQSIKVNKETDLIWLTPFVKIMTRKNPIEPNQIILITRIIVSIFTIGIIGYTLDRIMHSFKSS